MQQRFPVRAMRRGQVVIVMVEEEANVGKGAVVDGEHERVGVAGGGGETRIVEFEEERVRSEGQHLSVHTLSNKFDNSHLSSSYFLLVLFPQGRTYPFHRHRKIEQYVLDRDGKGKGSQTASEAAGSVQGSLLETRPGKRSGCAPLPCLVEKEGEAP